MRKIATLVALIALITFIALFALTAGSMKEDAERSLTAEGYTNVQVDGIEWFECARTRSPYPSAYPMSRRAFYANKFTAINRDGKPVKGTVCSGRIIKSEHNPTPTKEN